MGNIGPKDHLLDLAYNAEDILDLVSQIIVYAISSASASKDSACSAYDLGHGVGNLFDSSAPFGRSDDMRR